MLQQRNDPQTGGRSSKPAESGINDELYVSGGMSELLLSYLDTVGLAAPDLREALKRLGGSSRMPIQTWWALLDGIKDSQPIPALGVHIGKLVKPHHLGVLGYLAASCETLGQALTRFQRFQPLLHNLSAMRVTVQGADCTMSWDADSVRSTRVSNEVVVSGLLSLARTLTARPDIVPTRIALPESAPAEPEIYVRLFGCPVQFGAPLQAVTLPRWILDLPINSRDPHLQALLDQQAEALLQLLPQPDAFLAALQHQLVNALQQGEPTLEQLAARLGTSSRTLHRRLEQRGLSFKQLLEELRYQFARRYLADASLSLPEIALLLGYSEQSAFTRAFRRWSATTPLQYRKTHL
jgi:AraC-like DNA-binding protein